MKKTLGIDLSLRSTGLVLNYKPLSYKLIQSDSKKINREQLLMYNWNHVYSYICEHRPDYINLEALSYDSISQSKDIIDGNHWFIRTNIVHCFPDIQLNLVEVAKWRNILFSSEERKTLKENKKKLKEVTTTIKTLSSVDKKLLAIENEDLILNSNIKYLTWLKLPDDIKTEFRKIGFNKGTFDLTDAYFISNFEDC